MTTTFHVNSPNVIYETIEGEVIVIDLETGTYFSLRGAGAAMWDALQHGATEADVAAAVARRYAGDDAEIASSVRDVLARLEEERLVRRADGEGGAAPPAVETGDGERLAFESPVLEKHTDMQDLILIDPVHEVDARGWPHAAETGVDR